MKKSIYILVFLFSVVFAQAQQSVQYSQFMLNDYGLNPAVAGTSKGAKIMLGRRTQWRGFDLAPETNFIGITKDFGKKAYKPYWHGVGIYFEQDKSGVFTSTAAYGTYAMHLKVSRTYFLSFGLNVGVKQAEVKNIVYLGSNDPALYRSDGKILLYPDIVPGMYLYSRKISIGISVRNLYKNSLEQGSKKIGTPTKLLPVTYITISKKYISTAYDFNYVPSIHIQSGFTSLPIVSFNFMSYYRKRVGVGLTYRMHDAISAIFQVRIFDDLVIGFAYDYTVSRFRAANANSTEIMMGYTPVMSSDDSQIRKNVSACPKFEY